MAIEQSPRALADFLHRGSLLVESRLPQFGKRLSGPRPSARGHNGRVLPHRVQFVDEGSSLRLRAVTGDVVCTATTDLLAQLRILRERSHPCRRLVELRFRPADLLLEKGAGVGNEA